MKKTIAIALIILGVVGINGQTTIISESFEDNIPPAGWNHYALEDSDLTWTKTSLPIAPDEDWVLLHESGDEGIEYDDWLVSPQITVDSALFLSFYEKNALMDNYNHSGVYVSVGSGDPNDGDFEMVYESDKSLFEYTLREIILAGYEGKNIYFAFRYTGTNAHEWYIDQLTLEKKPYFQDLSLLSVDIDKLHSGVPENIKLNVYNSGTQPLPSGLELDMYADGILNGTQTLGAELAPGKTAEITFPWDGTFGSYDFRFINKTADSIADNDTLDFSSIFCSENSFLQDFEEVLGKILPDGYVSSTEYYVVVKNWGNNSLALVSFGAPEGDSLFIGRYSVDTNSVLGFDTYISGDIAQAKIIYSTDGNDWNPLDSKLFSDTTFTTITFDLSPLAGQDVFISMLFGVSGDYNVLYLDNIFTPRLAIELSQNSLLADLLIDGITVTGFSENDFEYTVIVDDIIPVVSAVTQHDSAKITITQATGIPGSAIVEVTAENPDYTSTYTINFDHISGLNGNKLNTFNMYPNPATDKVIIETEKTAFIRVISMDGNEVYHENVTKDNCTIDVSAFVTGMYFVEVKVGDITKQSKLLVQ